VKFSPTAVTSYSGNVTVTGGGLSSALNIPVSGTGAAACSGTPTAGTATASSYYALAATTVTLTCSGYSATGGITFQWQKYVSGSWTNISGATNVTYSFSGLTATSQYQCVVTCSFSSSSATTASITINLIAASSCTPAYYYNASTYPMPLGTATYPFRVAGVSTLVDANGPSSAGSTGAYGYSNNTATTMTCTMNAGTTYNVTAAGSTTYSMSEQIWIDFNNDGTMQSSESVGGATLGTTAPHLFTITIPSGAAGVNPGTFRMRAIAEYNYHSYPNIWACPDGTTTNSNYYGEIRDYLVTIVVPPLIVANPTVLTFAPTIPGSSTAAQNVVFTASYLSSPTGSMTVTAPSGFQVYDNITSSTWVSSYTIPYTGSALASTTVQVRFSPSAITSYSGNVVISGGGATANIAVSGTGAAACSGTPTAGSVASAPSFGGSSTSFTLTCSGFTSAGGISFQWQKYVSGSWTNVSGATNSTYTFSGMTASTLYQCIVTCTVSSSSATTSPITVYYVPPATCTANWYYTTGCTNNMNVCSAANPLRIAHQTGTMSDPTTCVAAGYIDETATSYTATFNAGSTYSCTIGTNTSAYSMNYQVWIDFNSNGTFETSETIGGYGAGSSSATTTTQVISLVIPSGSTLPGAGKFRMRVEAEYYYHAYPNLLPCPASSTYSNYYGDVRDYVVTVNIPPTASASPTSLNFNFVSSGTTSSAMSTNLSGLYLSPASGSLTITAPTNYQVSPDGSTWYSTSYALSYSGSTVSSVPVYVRMVAPATSGTYSGNVAVTGGGLSAAYNIPVTGISAPACSGTVSGGTTVATPASATASSTIGLSLSGCTLASDLLYQWMQSTSGTAGTWSNISGATNSTCSVSGLSSSMYYYCLVYCVSSGSAVYSTPVKVNVYCVPSFYYSTSCSNGMLMASPTYPFKVNGVSSTSINDATACDGSNYKDQTGSYSVTLNAGSSYVFTVAGSTTYTMSYQVWIDFNNDGTFDATESVGGVGLATGSPRTFTVAIPSPSATMAPGTYRMRVEGEYNYHAYPSLYPCPTGSSSLSQYYGDVRDYTVVINCAPTLYNAPTTLSFPATTTGTSSGAMQEYVQAYYLTPSTGNVTVSSSSSNFLVQDASAGGSYAQSMTIAYTGGTISLGTINVQFNPAAVTSYSGTLTVSGGGASSVTATMSGNGAAACSGTPTGGTTACSPTSGNGSTIFTLTASGYTASGGITFQWQSSPTGLTRSWTNIGTTMSFSTTESATTYYQCIVGCTISGLSGSASASAIVSLAVASTVSSPNLKAVEPTATLSV